MKTFTDLTTEGMALLSQENICFLSCLVCIWTLSKSLTLMEELLALKDFLHLQGFLSPSLSCNPGAAVPGDVRTNGDSSFSNARLPERNKMYRLGMQNTQSFLLKGSFHLNITRYSTQDTYFFSTMTRYLFHQSNSLEPWIAADIFIEWKHYDHTFLKITILLHNELLYQTGLRLYVTHSQRDLLTYPQLRNLWFPPADISYLSQEHHFIKCCFKTVTKECSADGTVSWITKLYSCTYWFAIFRFTCYHRRHFHT